MEPVTRGRGAAAAGLVVGALLASCGSPEPPNAPADATSPNATPGGAAQPIATAEDFAGVEAEPVESYLAQAWVAEADLARGELLAYACRACHAFHADEDNPLGPNLAGVFGRRAGTGDFDYSEAMRNVDLAWTPEALEAWLANPSQFVPGTKMAFTGYQSAADRRDLIAYLLRQTAAP
ncbi:MAG: c-type cytochrome [Gammaproteobacteria bacterium]|nr:c-type cytochrome [Gammaproteobacteria bacterium]